MDNLFLLLIFIVAMMLPLALGALVAEYFWPEDELQRSRPRGATRIKGVK